MAGAEESTNLGACCLTTETEPVSKTSRVFKILGDGQIPNKKIVSDNFHYALFSLFDLCTFEDGSDRLSQNFGKQLPFYAP